MDEEAGDVIQEVDAIEAKVAAIAEWALRFDSETEDRDVFLEMVKADQVLRDILEGKPVVFRDEVEEEINTVSGKLNCPECHLEGVVELSRVGNVWVFVCERCRTTDKVFGAISEERARAAWKKLEAMKKG